MIAREYLGRGCEITPGSTSYSTGNDFNDLVVEITAIFPVATERASWTAGKALFPD